MSSLIKILEKIQIGEKQSATENCVSNEVQIPPLSTMELSPQKKKEKKKRKGIYHCRDISW